MWRHGWQRRGPDFTEVLEDVTDHRKVYRLVQSDRCFAGGGAGQIPQPW